MYSRKFEQRTGYLRRFLLRTSAFLPVRMALTSVGGVIGASASDAGSVMLMETNMQPNERRPFVTRL